MKASAKLFLCAALLCAPARAADDPVGDVYKEEAIQPYIDRLPDEPEAGAERPVEIPAYPREQDLVEVEVGKHGYNYRVFVDSSSLSAGDDQILYTAVLRSPSGVDNVSYEGIRCARHQFRRYAYGSGGRLHPLSNGGWQRIHRNRQNVYRNVLADEYFCPLPSGDAVAQIRARLERSGGGRDSFSAGEE
jgi:hypothetical protein